MGSSASAVKVALMAMTAGSLVCAALAAIESDWRDGVGINSKWEENWLGGRDSNPDTQIQSLQSYH